MTTGSRRRHSHTEPAPFELRSRVTSRELGHCICDMGACDLLIDGGHASHPVNPIVTVCITGSPTTDIRLSHRIDQISCQRRDWNIYGTARLVVTRINFALVMHLFIGTVPHGLRFTRRVLAVVHELIHHRTNVTV